jgi:hypothetical protein
MHPEVLYLQYFNVSLCVMAEILHAVFKGTDN